MRTAQTKTSGRSREPRAKSRSKIDSLESLFGFGYYHHFQIWIVQTLIALCGAVNYFHMYFMVADPPGWHCQDGAEVERCGKVQHCPVDGSQCEEREIICGGGNITFNKTENYLYTLPVQHFWICEKVSNIFSWIPALTLFRFMSILNHV